MVFQGTKRQQKTMSVTLGLLKKLVGTKEPVTRVRGVEIAVDIMRKGFKVDQNFKRWLQLVALIKASIPFWVHWFRGMKFQLNCCMISEILAFLPLAYFDYLNLLLLSLPIFFLLSKAKFKRTLLHQLVVCPQDKFHQEVEVPSIPLTNPSNLKAVFNLYLIFQEMHSSLLKRANGYLQTTVLIYGLKFLYICMQIVLFKKPLEDFKSPLFLVGSIFDFFMILSIFCCYMCAGDKVNNCDYVLQQTLNDMKRQVDSVNTEAKQDAIYLVEGQIDFVKRQADGSLVSETTNQRVRHSLAVNINAEVLEQMQEYRDALDFLSEQNDHFISARQVTFFGTPICQMYLMNCLHSVGLVVLVLVQELLSMGQD